MERMLALPHRAKIKPKNRLLAALPYEVQSSLQPQMKAVSLRRGTVLCEADVPLRRIYFIEAGAVSLVTIFEDGTSAEMATMNREGFVGIDALLGGNDAFGHYVVTMPGSALTLEVSRFRTALRESIRLRAACEAYAQAFLAQLLQNVACNSAHTIQQRCARWLLMCAGQTDDDAFALTQEYLAEMLGVRRSTVTVIASTLQQKGLIRYCRGSITVLNARGLEAVACECHRIVRTRYERLMAHAFESDPGESSA